MLTHELIKKLREDRGMSQEALAHAVGYKDRSSIAKVESGLVDLSQSKIAALAAVFGVTPADLLLGTVGDDPPVNSVDVQRLKKVPLLGRIACGEPILAEQNIEEYISLPSGVRADYALTCRGESMTGAGIQDGDVVFIRANTDVQNGQIAAVRKGDEATLKRLRRTEHGVILMPENPDYDPIIYTEGSDADVEILGLAVAYLHKLV